MRNGQATRCSEDELLKGQGTITRFNVFVGRGPSIGGSGLISGDDGEVVRVNYANLFFGHVRPQQIDGSDTYEGVRVKYVALPVNKKLGYAQAKAIRLEPAENNGNRNHYLRQPNKIGDPRYAGGID